MNNTHEEDDVAVSYRDKNAEAKRGWDNLIAEASKARANGDKSEALSLENRARRIEEKFVLDNRGLAINPARRFMNSSRSAAHTDDYVSVALAALWEAFLTWDVSMGYTFATYSRPYVEGAVRRAVAAVEAPEISYGDWTAGPKVRAAAARLEVTLGRRAGFDEIAAACGQTVTLVERVMMARPGSLDAPVGDGDATRGDLVADVTGDGNAFIDALSGDVEDPDFIRRKISEVLDDRELFVMLRRTGLDGGSPQTLNEVGQLLERNREAVRRVENNATAKLEAHLG